MVMLSQRDTFDLALDELGAVYDEANYCHCFGDASPGEFPLSANPSIVLHVLTAVKTLATCSFFRQPATFANISLIIQAGAGRRILISDSGQVYAFGKDSFGEAELQLGISSQLDIATYLVCLACQPSGMSVYSVGCGLGGKLGHASRTHDKYPRLIEEFHLLNLQPLVVAAGAWHAAADCAPGDGGRYGCLGHGNEECESAPKLVEALSNVKALHVATGDYTTFVVSDDGHVYSFGCGEYASLAHNAGIEKNICIDYRILIKI
ncbi:hypothetical protein PIB30_014470 [Stylosanthes scabra]|uniref:Uncharacterized protein n=1 Tax=Stylosanthes scabra TaxID=79078 RepID=A0ABU6W4T8_9FABA|nr:hypothetical protein [Stylosanthes scabra]